MTSAPWSADRPGLGPADDTPGRRVRAWLRERPVVADSLLALGLYVLNLSLLALVPRDQWPTDWAPGLGWAVVGMLPVVLRRRWFWPSVVVLSAYTAANASISFDLPVDGIALLVLTYTAAAWRSTRQALLATGLMWVPGLAYAVALGASDLQSELRPVYFVLFNVMAALVCFLLGRAIASHRAYLAALRVRAETAEDNQRRVAEQAVADERRRIARELHDVVAHHVSVMGVLATGARRVLRRDPDSADEVLTAIEETGRTALREMRRLLSVLRTEAEPAAELAPQPGLTGITTLVEQVREAGLPVLLRVDGEPESLDPGVALTVFRIVQEALTNTLKHAGDATAEVRLGFTDGHLTLEVHDTGVGPRPDSARLGHGLLGMRERVALYGGTLRTGPRAGGGYRVSARIPVVEGVS